MKGYHNKPEATAEAITEDGWFRTGDIGRVDDGGYIFVEDRLKDMIITGGENVYSIEVERVLAEHPAVAEVAVIGVPDEKWGEAVKAVVALEGEATETGAHRVRPRAAGRLQVPEDRRRHGRAAAQPHRQDPEEGSAQAALGGPRPRHGLTSPSQIWLSDGHLAAAPEWQSPWRVVEPGDGVAAGWIPLSCNVFKSSSVRFEMAFGPRSPLKRNTATVSPGTVASVTSSLSGAGRVSMVHFDGMKNRIVHWPLSISAWATGAVMAILSPRIDCWATGAIIPIPSSR